MQSITDMHCHILPGLDDGCRDMEECMAVLRQAERQGIRHIIVTPHFHPGRYEVYAPRVLETLRLVRTQCRANNIKVNLYPGQECYYYSGLVSLLDQGKVLTLAGSRYVLVEFEPDCLYQVMLTGLQELKQSGYRPVLAHFERYGCLRKRERLAELRERGYLLQMNYDRLREKDTLFHRNPWRKLVRDGMVDYLGSDCHGTALRPLHAEEAYRWMEAKLPSSQRQKILYENIKKIIESTD